MQASSSSTPQPAVAPAAPATGVGQAVVVTPPPPPPLTAQELASIRARRRELSSQLTSAESRRERLADALEGAQGADRVGLEQRIALLDERILQLEADIATTGRQLTSAPSGLVTSIGMADSFGGLSSGQVTGISIVFIIFVLAPLAMAAGRRMWKRAAAPVVRTDLSPVTHRLEQLEHAVDSVAIEVERISEGQRFVTRLLSEGQMMPVLGAGQRPAEPIHIPDHAPAAAPRRQG